MGWSSEEPKTTKKGMETSSKILLAIIVCVIFIIILIVALMIAIEKGTYTISVDGENVDVTKNTLLSKVDGVTYINIQEFSKLVNYEYHKGEYKSFTVDEDKCYVQGKNETASFYLNDNKVCKLPVNKVTEEYQEYITENTVKEINSTMYAAKDTIQLAFNVVLTETNNSLSIYTLDYLVSAYDTQVKKWGYTGLTDQNFENKKSLLYGYLIVKKENGLYKIIDNENQKEIVSDRYKAIQFNENSREFVVTNSLDQVGIINLDGTTKIEPIYNSIEILDKESELYLVEKNKKYGVVKSGNITIIQPEYDKVGLDTSNLDNIEDNKYLILDTLIPVYKENKWGAYDKSGKLVYKLEYDGFGCNITTVEVNSVRKEVEKVLAIERCNGVVVKQSEKYGLIDLNGNELVPIAVDSIYGIKNAKDEDSKYFMIYKNEELNVIERLIIAGLLEDTNTVNKEDETTNNNVVTNNSIVTNVNNYTNQIINTISNNIGQ